VDKAKLFPSSRERIWLFAMVLVFVTIFAYRPAWNGGFVWDDDNYVAKNHLLTSPDGLRRIWFSLESPSQYFPLTYTSFRIERALWDLKPTGYHWVNILLHAANALLLWRLLAELGVPGAWLAAGIFALHPVQVESVAWITERKNVLMGFFFLLTLLAWTRFIDGWESATDSAIKSAWEAERERTNANWQTQSAVVALLLAGLAFLSAGALQQIDRLHAACGALPDFVATEETNRLAASFANCAVCRSRVSDGFDGNLVGTLSSGHARADVCAWAAGAPNRCYSRRVVLSGQIILAGEADVHLSAVDD
jgi:hypothetical protein